MDSTSEQSINRRTWLRRAFGVAAGATAASATTVIGADRALAATPPVLLGTVNNAADRTTEIDGTSSFATVMIANADTSAAGSQTLRAVRRGGADGIAITGGTTSANGKGVYGFVANGGAGVYGESVDGRGVGVVAAGGRAQLQIKPAPEGIGPPVSELHERGDIYVDAINVIWRCHASGAPGKWLRDGFTPLHARLYDTAASPLAAGHNRSVHVLGQVGVPNLLAVAAVSLNVTVLNPSASGDLVVWPGGTKPSPFTTMRVTAGRSATTSTSVAVGPTGDILLGLSAGAARVVLDVTGYFV